MDSPVFRRPFVFRAAWFAVTKGHTGNVIVSVKNERWINQTGLNLIRIVIGSYFMAVSLDLVVGVDQTVLFAPLLSPALADLVGSTLLFVVSLLFMTGVSLRMTSLTLAIFVLTCSIIQNFLFFEFGNLSDFWRDVTLACAVMLNYSILGRREMRRASILARRAQIRRVGRRDEIAPRRVQVDDSGQGRERPARGRGPFGTGETAASPVARLPAPTTAPRPAARTEERIIDTEEDGDNIFVNV